MTTGEPFYPTYPRKSAFSGIIAIDGPARASDSATTMDDELDELVASMRPRLRLPRLPRSPRWVAILLAPLCAILGAVGGMYGAGLFASAVFEHGDVVDLALFGLSGLVGGLVAGVTVGAGVVVRSSMGKPIRTLPWIAGSIAFALGAPMLFLWMLSCAHS